MTTIHVKRFWTEYKTVPVNGEMQTIERDMCEYGPLGALDRTSVVASISNLSKVLDDPDNPAAFLARMRWDQIKPRYDDWKSGRETPKDGTPLAAWPGLSHEQVEHLRMLRVTTVEELSQLTDSHISRLDLPNMRSLVEQAKIYVSNKGTAAIVSEMERLKAEIEALKEENAAARQALLADEDPEPVPPRRGRPPKVVEQQEAV
jgi:hypothetical protein